MRVVTRAEMRAIDAAAVARDGEVALMTRAGSAIAALIERYAHRGPIVGIAGNGNNGGDVYAALAACSPARERIVYGEAVEGGSAARRDAVARARAAGVRLRSLPVDAAALRGAGLILDGILGANARLPLDPVRATHVAVAMQSGAPVLAIDVPTGIDPETGAEGDPTITAVATIALGFPKLGCLLEPGRARTGDLWVAHVGMVAADAAGAPPYEVLAPHEFAALLPQRADESDKRRSGAPLIVAGSEQFPGAAVLCARGAARAGAGYVTVATPAGAAATLRGHLIEQVVATFDERDPAAAAATILDLTNRCSAIGIGPGLGLSDAVGEIVRTVVAGTDLPIVADAGALFHLGKHLGLIRGRRIVLTPHAGEFARLSGRGTIAPGERIARLLEFVDAHGVTTLLKGAATLVSDGTAVHVNPTGTPALATAGTGDVLTGMIATLLAQGRSPVDAARAAAYWHGCAGARAAAERPVGVIAGDLPERLAVAARPTGRADDPPGLVRLR